MLTSKLIINILQKMNLLTKFPKSSLWRKLRRNNIKRSLRSRKERTNPMAANNSRKTNSNIRIRIELWQLKNQSRSLPLPNHLKRKAKPSNLELISNSILGTSLPRMRKMMRRLSTKSLRKRLQARRKKRLVRLKPVAIKRNSWHKYQLYWQREWRLSAIRLPSWNPI